MHIGVWLRSLGQVYAGIISSDLKTVPIVPSASPEGRKVTVMFSDLIGSKIVRVAMPSSPIRNYIVCPLPQPRPVDVSNTLPRPQKPHGT